MKNGLDFFGLQAEYLKQAAKGFSDGSRWIVKTVDSYTYICNTHAISRIPKESCVLKDNKWLGNNETLTKFFEIPDSVLLHKTGYERIKDGNTLVELESDDCTFKVYLNKKYIELFGFESKYIETLFYGTSPKAPVYLSVGIPCDEFSVRSVILPVFINEK